MDVSLVVVNYNTKAYVEVAVRSALAQRDVDLEVLVVDNASSDGGQAALKRLGTSIELILNEDNVGFGRANNQAFRRARGRYLFLLNPDAVFEGDRALARLVAHMDAHPECGMVGTGLVDAEGREETAPFLVYPRAKHMQRRFEDLPGRIAWMLAASVMVRREAYEATKGFDEDFFLYGEDTDWCLRIRQAGYRLEHLPEVVVRHVGGASERGTGSYDLWMRKQRGLLLFFDKHYDAASIERLVRREGRLAALRMGLLSLSRALGGSAGREGKLERYRAIRDSGREFLRARARG